MTIEQIFLLQFAASLLVFAIIARWYAGPWLAQMPLNIALGILILPHAFRHIGLTFLVPGVGVSETIPEAFAASAGYGDLASAGLAVLAMLALRGNWTVAIPLTWLFNLVGFIDLANALRQAEAVPHFLSMWYVPTFFVPLLLISHVMIFAYLIRAKTSKRSAGDVPQTRVMGS